MTTPEIRAIIAEEMNRWCDIYDKEAGPCKSVDICRKAFPLPSPPVPPSPADDWQKWARFEPNTDSLYGRYVSHSGAWQWGPVCREWTHNRVGPFHPSMVPECPPPDYIAPTPPLPAKVEGDGTVGPEYVEANAGEYHDGSGDPKFMSDGNGSVIARWVGGGEHDWAGVDAHRKARTRFRPLPLPPKDPAASAPSNPSEHVASGGPVNPYQPYIGTSPKQIGWDEAAAAWRGYTASLRLSLSQSQHEAEKAKGELEEARSQRDAAGNVAEKQGMEIARLQSELAGVRGRMEPFRLAEGFYEKLNPPYAPNWKCLSDDTRRFYTEAAEHSSRPLAPAEVKK